jgi:hypothetical protein
VTQFNDKQGLITLTASSAYATVGTQPGFTFASNTSTYTATTTITPAAFTTSSTDFTLAIIANHTTEGIVNALPFNIGISGPRLCPFFSYDGVAGRVSTFADCAAPADPRLGVGSIIVSGSPSVVIYRRSGSTVSLRVAGATAASYTFSSPSSFASSNYTVTMSPGGAKWWGTLFEVLHYSAALSDVDVVRLEGYLTDKWSLRASMGGVSHPNRFGPPMILPNQIPGCAFWLDAADATTFTLSGSNISQWRDKSSNGFAGTAVSSPTLQSNSINGLPAVQFNGSSQYINFGNVLNIGTSQISVFAVTRFTGNAGVVGKGNYCGTFGRWGLYRYESTATMYVDNSPNPGGVANFSNSATTTQLLAGSWDRTTVTGLQNGVQQGSASFSSSSNFSNTHLLIVGGFVTCDATAGVPGFYLNGVIGEVLIYLGPVTTLQRQQVEGYLAWKWGLQSNLPSPTTAWLQVKRALSPVFTPTQIPGCAFWIDAADAASMTLSGSNVTQWRDKSSNGYLGTSAGSPVRTTVDGYDAVTFNGSSQYFNFGDVLDLGTNHLNIFIVSKFNSTANGTLIAKSTFGGSGRYSLLRENGNLMLLLQGDSAGSYPTIADTNTARRILRWTWDRTTQGLFQNGGNAPVVSASLSDTTSLNTSNLFLIGAYNDGFTGQLPPNGIYFNGSINEIICIFAPMTTAQYQRMEGYLAEKWGLRGSLGGLNHPYRFGPEAILPTQISGCSLWLDAADSATLILSGSNITQWRDKSGRGYHGVAVGTPTIQSLSNSMYQGVLFSGSSGFGYNNVTAMNPGQFLTTFVVAHLSGGGAFTRILGFAAPGVADAVGRGGCVPFVRRNADNKIMFERGTGEVQTAIPITQSVLFQGSTVFGPTSAIQYINGQSNVSVSYVDSSFNYTRYGVGQNGLGTGEFWTGVICEVITYDALLTTTQRQQVEGYLAWKWGLQSELPISSHPYKTFKP